MKILLILSSICSLTILLGACTSMPISSSNIAVSDGAYLFSSSSGETLRITPYGDAIVRIQRVRSGEDFFADNRYEMVEKHQWPGSFSLQETKSHWQLISPASNKKLHLSIHKKNLTVAFSQQGNIVLAEKNSLWQGETLVVNFDYDREEHFTGLGHGFFGREQSIDLKGQTIARNYGKEQINQAPLIVPFYMSSKGYGVFLNSTFSNRFTFGKHENYSVAIDDSGYGGRLDYFFISGPKLTTVLDNYTQLTGRPRLPMKSIFGLQLSDKGHDHESTTPSSEQWWREKINAHRAAGFPIDHVINDNRWRAAGGQRCISKLDWDEERYPDPQAYAQWLTSQGLISTLDFNRCIAQFSDAWQAEYNIPETAAIDFKDSAPDLTNAEFRQWFWDIFYRKSLAPELAFPGEALWIDEFDEMGAAPATMLLANGLSWAEMRNYWFFLIAKALVQQGWDTSDINQRPFVWVRGMTAGAQRYASLWSGDIYPEYTDMEAQIRAMQLAGLSGFPYWGHDAGGFYNWETNLGPDDDMYMQWAMAFGSFSPIWKPHGMGESRWPLDRSASVQKIAHKFSHLRYELMPYLYSAAHQAAATGMPIARAMLLDYQNEANAWAFDLQYMWGDSLLIAPNASADEKKELWLPRGNWFDYDSKQLLTGDRVVTVAAPAGSLPMYVKQGAIIPKRKFALATAFIDKKVLMMDIYAGADGAALLIEDDDTTEAYRHDGQMMKTNLRYDHRNKIITIGKAQGSYTNAPTARAYTINVFGNTDFSCAHIDGNRLVTAVKESNRVTIEIAAQPLDRDIVVQSCRL